MVASGRGHEASLLQTDDAEQLIRQGLEKTGLELTLHANEQRVMKTRWSGENHQSIQKNTSKFIKGSILAKGSVILDAFSLCLSSRKSQYRKILINEECENTWAQCQPLIGGLTGN